MGLALPSFLLPDEIHVRVMQLRDVDVFLEAVHESVNSVGKWLPWCSLDYSHSMAEEWIHYCRASFASGRMFEFGIFQSGEYVGGIGLNQTDMANKTANLGYWMRTSYQGRGIMTSVARRVAEWGLDKGDLGRIGIIAAVDNVPSRRIAENIGAQFEGILRSRLVVGENVYDAAQYSLVAGDIIAGK